MLTFFDAKMTKLFKYFLTQMKIAKLKKLQFKTIEFKTSIHEKYQFLKKLFLSFDHHYLFYL